jgi:3-dehydroquinate dehydratase-1
MKHPPICGVVTTHEPDAIRSVTPLVDLFELRLDLVGPRWPDTARLLDKRWIATNRIQSEGGAWAGSEDQRVKELVRAVESGAGIVDIELTTPELERVLSLMKGTAECIVSYHNMLSTPPLEILAEIIEKELAVGADICKVATMAKSKLDNAVIMKLISKFSKNRIVILAMGEYGRLSRVNGPLRGCDFAYAAIREGGESAQGQPTVRELISRYKELGYD